jgi:phosphatidylserine/phosphatidylglycerophosphate/cardiolipin synthase-like enzyme
MVVWKELFSFGVTFNRATRHGRSGIIRLANQARKSIHILSGELNKDFYSDGNMKEALVNAANRKVDVQIAFGPLVRKESIREFKSLFGHYDNVKLYQLNHRPERHYMIFDNETIRLQHVHPPNTEEPKAIIVEKSPLVAKTYDNVFEELVTREGKPV